MNATPFRPDPDAREELAPLLPAPVERDLPSERHSLLKEFVMNEIQQDPRPAAPVHRRLRPWPVLLASALAAAAALVMAVPVLLGGGTPAYAVAENTDGSITIRIREFKDPKELQADLRDLGVNVIVDFVPNGKACKGPRVKDVAPRKASGLLTFVPNDEQPADDVAYRLDPSVLRPGEAALIEFYDTDETPAARGGATNGWITSKPISPCTLIDSAQPWPWEQPAHT